MNERNNESRNGGRNENAAVDMVATAQAVQQAGDAWRGPGTVKLVAPAKVNLFLGIGSRREDGYHEAVSILHAIALHDVLYLRRATAPADSGDEAVALAGPAHNISVRVECIAREGLAPLSVAASENIVFRAIDALAHEVGRTEPDFLEVRLEKHIPHQAGLGGGSSDAAAALLGTARLWGMALDDPVLERVAHRLGSDVAFFLHGGCAYFDATGERFDHALEPMKRSLVLVRPAKGVSTAEAYRIPTEILINKVDDLKPDEEEVMRELTEIYTPLGYPCHPISALQHQGTTFAMVNGVNEACRLTAAAQAKGWWARSTTFGSLKAAIVP